MNLKELVRAYVQQRTVMVVDGRHFEAGKEFAVLRRQPSSESVVNAVDALDYALGLLNQKDAEIARLQSQLEQVDTVRNGWMGCQPAPTVKPETCSHDWVISDNLPNKFAAATEAFCKKCGIGNKENAMKWLAIMQGDEPEPDRPDELMPHEWPLVKNAIYCDPARGKWEFICESDSRSFRVMQGLVRLGFVKELRADRHGGYAFSLTKRGCEVVGCSPEHAV